MWGSTWVLAMHRVCVCVCVVDRMATPEGEPQKQQRESKARPLMPLHTRFAWC